MEVAGACMASGTRRGMEPRLLCDDGDDDDNDDDDDVDKDKEAEPRETSTDAAIGMTDLSDPLRPPYRPAERTDAREIARRRRQRGRGRCGLATATREREGTRR